MIADRRKLWFVFFFFFFNLPVINTVSQLGHESKPLALIFVWIISTGWC